MQYLPNREEQDWVLGVLASLITTCGYAQFVTMPIVEPIPQFFPDPWAFSHIGLDRVTRRLMQYAGLSALAVDIRTYAEHQTSGTNSETQCSQTIAGAFLGI